MIVRTAFLTSLASYAAFFFLDVLRPGFVSHVFSVHWFLVPVLFFGMWWGVISEEDERSARRFLNRIIETFVGFLLALVVWRAGAVFGDFRLVAALVTFVVPLLTVKLLRICD